MFMKMKIKCISLHFSCVYDDKKPTHLKCSSNRSISDWFQFEWVQRQRIWTNQIFINYNKLRSANCSCKSSEICIDFEKQASRIACDGK